MRKVMYYSVFIFFLLIAYTGCSPTSGSATISIDRSQCIGCAKCINVCRADAIRILSNKAVIDPDRCIKCGNCVEICPVNAVY